MQVGDLVRWQDAYGNGELGVVLELCEEHDAALVYFPQDSCNSLIHQDDLEVV